MVADSKGGSLVGDVLQFPTHKARLVGLSQRERDSRQAWTHDLRARNAAIVEAVEDGYAQNRVAADCGLKPSSITRILALPDYSGASFDDAA